MSQAITQEASRESVLSRFFPIVALILARVHGDVQDTMDQAGLADQPPDDSTDTKLATS